MIGLLTGTFDPVHAGHIALAEAALRQGGLEAVWFLVNPDPTHKLAEVDASGRRAMVALAVEGRPGLALAPLTPQLNQLPHTWPGFCDIMAAFSDQRFVYVVGMDNFLHLDRWAELESVVRHTTYMVVHRPGSSLDGVAELRQRLGPLGDLLQVTLVDGPVSDASSTLVRRAIRTGNNYAQWVSPSVGDYIQEHHLYQLA